ncbi:Fibronectin type III-like domain [Rhizoctonia solani]|uniref:Probable beta-glucosidase G n=1 Tax=Rhizoctonia solani TaxID=456999 RepID=A0A8H7M1G1_9AGAM|nr:Fibronectin type III-like domain [Rhizoctonia solani]
MRGAILAASLTLYFNCSLAHNWNEGSQQMEHGRVVSRIQSNTGTPLKCYTIAALANGGSAWESAFAKAKDIVSQMTLEEKVNIVTGIGHLSRCAGNTGAVPRLGIPALCMQDGPAGVRPADFASQFPAQVTVAATWDRDLIYDRAVALAAEFKGKGVHVMLGPVTGGPLGRSPLGGRNWEGFSADPYLSSVGSYLSVKGTQDQGVVATSKHYSVYEQETNRNLNVPIPGAKNPIPISSDVDDATFHETYLLSFAEAVRAGSGSIMCAYNRGELNFQGYVMSDWFAQWNNADSALGGMDMSMPGTGFWGSALVSLINNGTVPTARLDDMVHRILTPYYALGQDEGYPSVQYNTSGINAGQYLTLNPGNTNIDVQADHYKVIRKIGQDSATLLKNLQNNGGDLPLKTPKFLSVFGQDAGPNPDGLLSCGVFNQCPTGHFNGTYSIGGGSGSAYAPYIVTPLEGIQARAKANTTQLEGLDRDNLTLWSNGDELINIVAAQCNNTIVVIHSLQWRSSLDGELDHNPNVTAVVFAYYPRQETGNAIASVLYGEVNPSGKLPFTIGKALSDYSPNGIATGNSDDPRVVFEERNLIDYRWFDAKNITPRFEFGFGLSPSERHTKRSGMLADNSESRSAPEILGAPYTTFEYSGIKIHLTPEKPTDGIQLTNEPFDGNATLYDVAYTVTATVKNTGSPAGCEVAQLYLSYPATQTSQPVRSLRGFDKLCIDGGKEKTATFKL